MVLVTLNEFGDGNRLFLVSPQFTQFAQTLPQIFVPAPGQRQVSAKNVTLPQAVLDSMAPVLEAPDVSQPFEVTMGSAENDAYMHVMNFVKVFDTHSDMLDYAQNKGIDVDEKNGFWGQIY